MIKFYFTILSILYGLLFCNINIQAANFPKNISGNIVLENDGGNFYFLKTDDLYIYLADEDSIKSNDNIKWLKDYANTDKIVTLSGDIEEGPDDSLSFKDDKFILISENNTRDNKQSKKSVNNTISPIDNYYFKCEQKNPEFITIGRFFNDQIEGNKKQDKQAFVKWNQISNNQYRFDLIITDPMTNQTSKFMFGFKIDNNSAILTHFQDNNLKPETGIYAAEICTRFLMPYYQIYKNKTGK